MFLTILLSLPALGATEGATSATVASDPSPRTSLLARSYADLTQDPPQKQAPVAPGTAAQEDAWRFVAAPYMWMFGLSGNVGVRGHNAGLDLSFSDLIDYADFTALAHTEIWKGRFGMLFDGVYGKLSDSGSVGPADVSLDVKVSLLELGGMYRIYEESSPREAGSLRVPASLDLLAGVRYTRIAGELDIGPFSGDSTEDWYDLFLGARYMGPISDEFSYSFRGDIGGFDIGDSSYITWNAVASLMWQCSKVTTVVAGYRILDQEYDHNGFKWDVQISGPILGVAFSF